MTIYVNSSIIKSITFEEGCTQSNPCSHDAIISLINGTTISTGFNRKEIKRLKRALPNETNMDKQVIKHIFGKYAMHAYDRIVVQEITPELTEKVNLILSNISLKRNNKDKIVEECCQLLQNTITRINCYLEQGLNSDQRHQIQSFLNEDFQTSDDVFNAAWNTIIKK